MDIAVCGLADDLSAAALSGGVAGTDAIVLAGCDGAFLLIGFCAKQKQ